MVCDQLPVLLDTLAQASPDAVRRFLSSDFLLSFANLDLTNLGDTQTVCCAALKGLAGALSLPDQSASTVKQCLAALLTIAIYLPPVTSPGVSTHAPESVRLHLEFSTIR